MSDPSNTQHQNRLALESSPYLRQHAHNPVDWYAWGDEAFELAKAEDKPIFLSIGYSTCHWCHVMAHESFEDEEVATYINRHFVCIKVDREELPDVDHIYMQVCIATTGSGGWPLTVLLTPDKVPIFAGTYFPKTSTPYRMGIIDLLARVHGLWAQERRVLLKEGEQVYEYLIGTATQSFAGELRADIVQTAVHHLRHRYDSGFGGFGSAPKFPMFHQLAFLIQQGGSDMGLHTLQAIRLGGIYDHIGFGVHRYSTDAEWKLPHFEKMLYDQALAVSAYVDAYLFSKNEFFKQTINEIITYVLRDLCDDEGAFYAGQDADSEGVEGKFYVWDEEEFKNIETQVGAYCHTPLHELFNIVREGNFKDEATHEITWKNIPYLSTALGAEQALVWEPLRKKLFEARKLRVHPGTDHKIITAWNGLMISALARAGRALQQPQYLEAAQKAYAFIRQKLVRPDGRLLRCYTSGQAQHLAVAEDYAFMIAAALDLYESSFQSRYLVDAVALQQKMVDLFWDHTQHGFFFAGSDAPHVLVRIKEFDDGAVPSANSVSLNNLLRLWHMTGGATFETIAKELSLCHAQQLNQHPTGFTTMLLGVAALQKPLRAIVVVGNHDSDEVRGVFSFLAQHFLPDTVWVFLPSNKPDDAIFDLCGRELAMQRLAEAKQSGQPLSIYVCQNFACQQPVHTLEALKNLLF